MKLYYYLCERCSSDADEGLLYQEGMRVQYLPSSNPLFGIDKVRTCDCCTKRATGYFYAHPNHNNPDVVAHKLPTHPFTY